MLPTPSVQYEEYFPTEDWRAGRGRKGTDTFVPSPLVVCRVVQVLPDHTTRRCTPSNPNEMPRPADGLEHAHASPTAAIPVAIGRLGCGMMSAAESEQGSAAPAISSRACSPPVPAASAGEVVDDDVAEHCAVVRPGARVE